jgi:probable HAF family extracellular repeat protein
VIGGSTESDSGQEQAFRWTAAKGMVGLGFPPGDNWTIANGVNADGSVVVGQGQDAVSGQLQAFRWMTNSRRWQPSGIP